MSDVDTMREYSCRDECGTRVLVPVTDSPATLGWMYLSVSRRWRCPECVRALQQRLEKRK